ncbi:MAG: hypothetical protein AAF992_22735 [Bacteroidota bacterium]
MPANTKYLTQSPWIKFGRLSAAILGSLIAAVAFHLALAAWLDPAIVFGTSIFTIFILWTGLMLVTYWLRKVWQVWSLLLLLIGVSSLMIYLN